MPINFGSCLIIIDECLRDKSFDYSVSKLEILKRSFRVLGQRIIRAILLNIYSDASIIYILYIV